MRCPSASPRPRDYHNEGGRLLAGNREGVFGEMLPVRDIPRSISPTCANMSGIRISCPGGLVNGHVLGATTVKVVNGVAEATFTVEFFARGNFTFDAQCPDSSQFQGSTSNAVTVNVF